MSIFGIIFFLLFIFIILPFLIILIRTAFFVHRARNGIRDAFRGTNDAYGQNGGGQDAAAPRRSKKIDPNEGEYVAFEDITISATETSDNRQQHTRYTVEQQIVDAEWEDIPDSK